jgi:hypothetical protein
MKYSITNAQYSNERGRQLLPFYFFGRVFSLFLLPIIKADSSFAKAPEDKGAVAQLVEQRTENPCVGGSIPPHTTSPGNTAGAF